MQDISRVTPKEAIALGAESLILYGQLFFPKTFRQESPQFHHEIGKQLYENHRLNAFEVFRDGAKTSLLRVFMSQRIAYGISRTIMLVSSSQGHSCLSLRWLRRQVMYNTKWAQLFGLRKGEKWTDEIAEIYHGVEEQPITVLAMGITGQIRGFNIDDYRPDLIIADDVETDENVATLEQRNKLKTTFHGALVNSLAPPSDMPQAKVVLLNTPIEKDDLIEECMADPSWKGARYGIFDDEGNSRWETRWPTADMKKAKESATLMGRYSIWMKEKECKVVKSEHKTFDVSKVKFYDLLPDGLTVVGAIDPASSAAKKADNNVVLSVGRAGPDFYVLQYSAEKGEMPDKTAAHFFEQVLTWRHVKFVVETIGFQRVLSWYLKKEMTAKRIFVPIIEVQDRRSKNHRIVQALAGLIAMGHLHIKPGMSELLQELDDFDPSTDKNKDDIIDALSMGVDSESPSLIADDSVLDVEMRRIEDEESNYEQLDFGGCP